MESKNAKQTFVIETEIAVDWDKREITIDGEPLAEAGAEVPAESGVEDGVSGKS